MNAAGNRLMAEGVLKAFGLDEDQLKKTREAWAAIKPPAPKPAAPKPAAQAPAKPAEQPVPTDVLPEKK